MVPLTSTFILLWCAPILCSAVFLFLECVRRYIYSTVFIFLILHVIIFRQCSFPNPCTRSLFNIIYIHKCMGIVTYKYLYKNNKNKKVPYITIFLQKNPFSTIGCPLNASGLSCLLSRKNIRLYQASSSELLVRHTKSHRKKSLPFIPDLLTAVRTTKIILPYSNVSS